MSEPANTAIRCLIADDQAMVRESFAAILAAQPGITVAGLAADGAQAVRETARLAPDVVLLDVRMPVMDGLAAAREILADGEPAPHVLMLTTFDLDDYVYEALRAGASGFLLKDATTAELVHAVRVVAAGDALLEPTAALTSDLGWREQAKAGLRAYRAVLRSHRDAPRLLAERPPVGPIRRRLADAAVGLVLQAGFPEADAAVISLLLGDYVISIVGEEMRIEAQAAQIAPGEEIPWQDSEEYHNLAQIAPHLAALQPEALFETGLEVLLDGIEQRLKRLRDTAQ
jgi:DNA-binding NarL/FixJ family response regulator